jgi:hypothetical protein
MKSLKNILPLLLLLVILIETPLHTSAQRRRSYKSALSNSTFSYGATSGIAISNLTPENSSTSNNKLGYFGGGYFEYKFAEKFGGQIEVNFTQLGGENIPSALLFNPNSIFLNDVKSIDLSIYGVDIPLTAKYHFTDLIPEFYINLGLSGTYILKAQAALYEETSIGGMYSTNTTYVDVTKKVQDMQACAVAGCGTSIPIGDISILINLSFHYGITDLSANNIVAKNGFNSKFLNLGIGIGF